MNLPMAISQKSPLCPSVRIACRLDRGSFSTCYSSRRIGGRTARSIASWSVVTKGPRLRGLVHVSLIAQQLLKSREGVVPGPGRQCFATGSLLGEESPGQEVGRKITDIGYGCSRPYHQTQLGAPTNVPAACLLRTARILALSLTIVDRERSAAFKVRSLGRPKRH